MTTFLSSSAIQQLWVDKLLSIAPRLAHEFPKADDLLTGQLHANLGLDSLDLFELASHFHGMFHMMEGGTDSYLLQYKTAEAWMEAISFMANSWDRPISFFSSGSQGKPKSCRHDKHLLIEEVETWATILQPEGNIWRTISPQHIYGFLFGVLLPDCCNIEVKEISPYDLPDWHNQLTSKDWLVGIPTLFETWLQSGLVFPAGIRAISSTSPLSAQTASTLYAQGMSITEIYGSSETAGIGFRQFPDDTYQLLPYWKQKGEQISRVNLEKNSLGNIQDHIQWTGIDRFQLGIRKDKAIQIAGQNIYPQQIVNRMKAQIQGIEDCWIRRMSVSEGNRLKCWVKTTLPPEEWKRLERNCYQWIDKQLSVPERPTHVLIQHHAPINSQGKAQDWEIFHHIS